MNKAIKKIELDLGGKTVSLTPAQAKNLKEALDDLFGKEIIKVIKKEIQREYIPYPEPYPVRPLRPYYWEWRPEPYRFGTSTNTGMLVSGTTCEAGNYSFDNDTLRLTG